MNTILEKIANHYWRGSDEYRKLSIQHLRQFILSSAVRKGLIDEF